MMPTDYICLYCGEPLFWDRPNYVHKDGNNSVARVDPDGAVRHDHNATPVKAKEVEHD